MSIARDAAPPRISGIATTVPPGESAVSGDVPVTHQSLADRLRRGSRAAMSTVFTEHVDTI